MFEPAGDAYQVSWPVAVAIAGTFVLLFGVAMTKVQARRRMPTTGREELLGQVGIVRRALDPGHVFVHGELWQARTAGEAIPVGARVCVEAIGDGLVLEVRQVDEPAVAPA